MAGTKETDGVRDSESLVKGRYRIRERIGSGTFGEVFCAEDLQNEWRRAAVKLLRPEIQSGDTLRRFALEGQILEVLGGHQNIVTIYDRGRLGDRAAVVMEFIPGSSLTQLIAQRQEAAKPLSISTIESLLTQIASALAHAHCRREAPGPITHRDLKPGNIMLVEQGADSYAVKLVDFGIAHLLFIGETQPGTKLGTPGYMAPEQHNGSPDDIGPWTDMYALGIILLELLVSGHPNMRGISLSARAKKPGLISFVKSIRTDVPLIFISILEKCLFYDKEERYQHAQALLNDLETEKSVATAAPAAVVAVSAAPSRRKAIFGAAALAFTLMLCAYQIAAAPARIRWVIKTEPQNAEVLDADTGNVIGMTPWQIERGAETGVQKIRIRHDDCFIKDMILDRSKDEIHQINLTVITNENYRND